MAAEVVVVVLGMSIVTFLPRLLPVIILSRMNLPQWFLTWLKYVPVAVLAALLAPLLLIQNGQLAIGWENLALLASLPCFLVAAKTKSLSLTVTIGIIATVVLRYF